MIRHSEERNRVSKARKEAEPPAHEDGQYSQKDIEIRHDIYGGGFDYVRIVQYQKGYSFSNNHSCSRWYRYNWDCCFNA